MSSAQWIWFNGDFELYHSILLHSRREQFGSEFPCFWSLSAPFPSVCFHKDYHSDSEDTVRLVCRHKAFIRIDGVQYPSNTDIIVSAGDHRVHIICLATSGFPAIYINSRYLVTDESWTAGIPEKQLAEPQTPVGTWSVYNSPDDDPQIFPFNYERRDPIKTTDTSIGRLYDFGQELFGRICIIGADPDQGIKVIYGESEEEACDPDNAIITQSLIGKSVYTLVSRAFRYISIIADNQYDLSIYAEYEYLPLEYRGYFTCNRRSVNKVWEVCSHTLHLNSREFFLDGIKRDRWCWSGDAYQSFMANN